MNETRGNQKVGVEEGCEDKGKGAVEDDTRAERGLKAKNEKAEDWREKMQACRIEKIVSQGKGGRIGQRGGGWGWVSGGNSMRSQSGREMNVKN